MHLHTLVIGTSKSKNQNGYYIEAKDKFWGLLFKTGITKRLLDPSEFRLLSEKHGIGFSELAFNHIFFGDSNQPSYSNDQQLKSDLHVLQEGVPLLLKYLSEINPKRIVFNGKTAASVFMQQIDHDKIEGVNAQYINRKGLGYGKIGQWKGIEMYMLPNLSAAAGKTWKEDNGENEWSKFWTSIQKDCHPSHSKWIWLAIILLIITTIFLINKN